MTLKNKGFFLKSSPKSVSFRVKKAHKTFTSSFEKKYGVGRRMKLTFHFFTFLKKVENSLNNRKRSKGKKRK